MPLLRLRNMAWVLLLCVMVMMTGCQSDKTKQSAAKEAGGSPQDKASLTPMKLEAILTNKQDGTFSGDRYNQQAVQEQLQEMPKWFTGEETYAYLLSLVGESYSQYLDTFVSLENPTDWQKVMKVDPNSPVRSRSNLKVEVLLDCSGSMADSVPGGVKMDLAKQSVQSFVAKLPLGTQVGLRAFGHKGSGADKDKAVSCGETELVYPISAYEEVAFSKALQPLSPQGWTPIAGTLIAAGKDLSAKQEKGAEYIIYMVSDGLETCDGDPVAAARSLHQSEIQAVVNIIGFDVDDAAQKQLKEASTAGGGDYVTVKNQEELQKAFRAETKARIRENLINNQENLKSISLSLSETSMTERHRSMAIVAYLRDTMSYKEWPAINERVLSRWTLLKDYRVNENLAISKKILDENLAALTK